MPGLDPGRGDRRRSRRERAPGRTHQHPPHDDEGRPEGQEPEVPGERAAEVVADVVHAKELVVEPTS